MVQQKKIYTKDKDEKLILQDTPVNRRVEVSSEENRCPAPVDEIFLYVGGPGGRMMSVLNAWWGSSCSIRRGRGIAKHQDLTRWPLFYWARTNVQLLMILLENPSAPKFRPADHGACGTMATDVIFRADGSPPLHQLEMVPFDDRSRIPCRRFSFR